MNKCILIIDSDRKALDVVCTNLTNEGYSILSASNGHTALGLVEQHPDLIILDMVLDDMHGIDIIHSLKSSAATAAIPILVSTARGSETDEIIGLEVGADDYLVKPVQAQRLLARVRTIFRRQQSFSLKPTDADVLSIEGIDIHIPNYTISFDQTTIEFPRKEFETLLFLVRRRGLVVTREALYNEIWGMGTHSTIRTIDVHIGRIRRKLNGYAHLIETVPSVGYRFQA